MRLLVWLDILIRRILVWIFGEQTVTRWQFKQAKRLGKLYAWWDRRKR